MTRFRCFGSFLVNHLQGSFNHYHSGGGIKQYKCVVIFKDFPCDNALFGLVCFTTPDLADNKKQQQKMQIKKKRTFGLLVEVTQNWEFFHCQTGGYKLRLYKKTTKNLNPKDPGSPSQNGHGT